MGLDREAVVDAELRVRGVDGLRIADASVIPTIPAANTNAPSIMIGEFASRLLTGVRASRAVAGKSQSQRRDREEPSRATSQHAQSSRALPM
jgi:choline dehydrogenase-like flavoprotein